MPTYPPENTRLPSLEGIKIGDGPISKMMQNYKPTFKGQLYFTKEQMDEWCGFLDYKYSNEGFEFMMQGVEFIVNVKDRMVIMKELGREIARATVEPGDSFNMEHGILLCLVKSFICSYSTVRELVQSRTKIVNEPESILFITGSTYATATGGTS